MVDKLAEQLTSVQNTETLAAFLTDMHMSAYASGTDGKICRYSYLLSNSLLIWEQLGCGCLYECFDLDRIYGRSPSDKEAQKRENVSTAEYCITQVTDVIDMKKFNTFKEKIMTWKSMFDEGVFLLV